MNSSDFRKIAREKLEGKWGKAVLIVLAYMSISFILGVISGFFEESSFAGIISIIELIIEIPLSFGLICSFVNLFNQEDVKAYDFLALGFNNFAKSWGIAFRTLLKLIVPVILIVVSAIIIVIGGMGTLFTGSALTSTVTTTSFSGLAIVGIILYFVSIILLITWSYYYQLAYIIAAENPDMNAKEAVEASKTHMTGNRWKLFCLEFSFIGWAFLAGLTLGIGMLWLIPYIQIATIAFSKYVCGNLNETTTENTDNNQ